MSQVRSFSAAQYLALQEHLAGSAAVAAVARGFVADREGGPKHREGVVRARHGDTVGCARRPARARTDLYRIRRGRGRRRGGGGRATGSGRGDSASDPAAIGRTIRICRRDAADRRRDAGEFHLSALGRSDRRIWTPYVIPADERSGQQRASIFISSRARSRTTPRRRCSRSLDAFARAARRLTVRR